MPQYFEQLTIDSELSEYERGAIDALQQNCEKDIKSAIQTETIKWVNLNFLQMATAFSGKTEVKDGKLVAKDGADEWIKKMIESPDNNDFAYLIYKLSEILQVQNAWVETDKLWVNTTVQLTKLQAEILKTEVTTTTPSPAATKESLESTDIPFTMYGVTKEQIKDALSALQGKSPELVKKITPLLKEGNVLEIQKALGMKTTGRTSLADYADGKFGWQTLQNLKAWKVVEIKVSKSVPEDATPKKSDPEKIPAATDTSETDTAPTTKDVIEDKSNDPIWLEQKRTILDMVKNKKVSDTLATYLREQYWETRWDKWIAVSIAASLLNNKTHYWTFNYLDTKYFFVMSNVKGKIVVTDNEDEYNKIIYEGYMLNNQKALNKKQEEQKNKIKHTEKRQARVEESAQKYIDNIFDKKVTIGKVLNTYRIMWLSKKKEDYNTSIYPFTLDTEKIMTELSKIQNIKFTSEKAALAYIDKVKTYIKKWAIDKQILMSFKKDRTPWKIW